MNTIFGVEALKEVTHQILDWNYEPVKGLAVFTKTEKYAHIEISITTTEDYTDQIVWSVNEEFIPTRFHQEIGEVLTFFGNYLRALKGRGKSIVFEIVDGSFNRDTGRHAFMYATVWALVSCFNKEIFEVSPIKLDLIKSAKKYALIDGR